jgi:hypothetical protein
MQDCVNGNKVPFRTKEEEDWGQLEEKVFPQALDPVNNCSHGIYSKSDRKLWSKNKGRLYLVLVL